MNDKINSLTAEEKLAEAERRLAETEEKLAQAEEKLAETAQETPAQKKRWIEGIYDRIDVPVKYVDWFIAFCAAVFLVVVVLGWLKGHGYF